ncbi:MAG: retropepsin-like domain-containing protein, partial [Bacteroidia bacterium]|nr:retropepsin-like domain-containing protein [Bacteroidia bacterium]
TKSRTRKTIIPFHLVPLDDDGAHLVVDASINDIKIKLLIDTGASKTVFDRKRMRALMSGKRFKKNHALSVGLGTNKMKSHYAMLEKFSIGELELKNFQTVLLDLSIVNKSYTALGLSPIDGVLGGDILNQYGAEINYRKKQLSFLNS